MTARCCGIAQHPGEVQAQDLVWHAPPVQWEEVLQSVAELTWGVNVVAVAGVLVLVCEGVSQQTEFLIFVTSRFKNSRNVSWAQFHCRKFAGNPKM